MHENERMKEIRKMLEDKNLGRARRQRLSDEYAWEKYREDKRRPLSRELSVISGLILGPMLIAIGIVVVWAMSHMQEYDASTEMTVFRLFMGAFAAFVVTEMIPSMIFKTEPSDEMMQNNKLRSLLAALVVLLFSGVIVGGAMERYTKDTVLPVGAVYFILLVAAGVIVLVFSVSFMIFESGRADKPAFAAKIEEKLTERGMSPEELAAKVFVRPKTIRHIMKGIYSPSLRLERDIAKVLGCTADELFVFDDV